MLDVQRASDGFTRLTRLATQENGLYLRIKQHLDSSAHTWTEPVLNSNQADESIAKSDEHYASAFGL